MARFSLSSEARSGEGKPVWLGQMIREAQPFWFVSPLTDMYQAGDKWWLQMAVTQHLVVTTGKRWLGGDRTFLISMKGELAMQEKQEQIPTLDLINWEVAMRGKEISLHG